MHFVDAKGILSSKNGMNIYRGCVHGCIYCDSRSVCYGMKHDFEDIEVKQNAPQLLETALQHKRKKCMIGTGSMCDPYIPQEEKLEIMRSCLKIIEKYEFGVTIITKSTRILRDLELLKSIVQKSKCVVQMTLTTYDDKLCKILEPNVSVTSERVKALKVFRDNGIPTVVWLTPLLPFINDTEENLRGILNYCFEAGVKGIICFAIGTTMREGSREYFYQCLDKNFKGLRQKYFTKYGYSYNCESENNKYLMNIFHKECEAHGVMHNVDEIFSYLSYYPTDNLQMSLF